MHGRRLAATTIAGSGRKQGWREGPTARGWHLRGVMATTGHIGLLGDSTLDNGAYTRGAPDVVTHLRRTLPVEWTATLYAVDGATTGDVARQTSRVAKDVSHIVLSVGGNDALMNSDLLERPVRSTAETLALFADRVRAFEQAYGRALRAVLALDRPTIVCTIYNGNLEPARATAARVALMPFNDAILRAAFERALAEIDLRAVCASADHYADAIEPSGEGGRRIAAAIVAALGLAEARSSRVFANGTR